MPGLQEMPTVVHLGWKGGHNRKKFGTCQEQERTDFFFTHIWFSSLQERHLGPRCLHLGGVFGPENCSGLAQALNPEGTGSPHEACEGRNSCLLLWHGPYWRIKGHEGQAQLTSLSGRMMTLRMANETTSQFEAV